MMCKACIHEPLIAPYLLYSALFSYMDSEDEKIWLLKQCMNIFGRDDSGCLWVSFQGSVMSSKTIEASPYLDCSMVNHGDFDRLESLRDHVIWQISLKKCALLYIDYNTVQNPYNKSHIHDIFIHGVDTEKNVFYCGDHLLHGKFLTDVELDIDEVLHSHRQLRGDDIPGIRIFKKRKGLTSPSNGFVYNTVSKRFLIQTLRDFLGIERIEYFGRDGEVTYGIGVYSQLSEYIMQTAPKIDQRFLHLLYCHLLVLREVVSKIKLLGAYAGALDSIAKQLLLLRNLSVKCLYKQDIHICRRISEGLLKTKEELRALLLDMLACVESKTDIEDNANLLL